MKATLDIKQKAKNHIIYDVIISGAGPVGLFLACELALANCAVLILEKTADPYSPLKQLPFGIRGLSAPSIEALYRRGLLEELKIHKTLKNPHQKPGQGAARQVGHFAGIPFFEGDINPSKWEYRLPGDTDTSLISEIEELETVLIRRAALLGVEIKRGCATTHFHQSADGVKVQAGDQNFKSKWLVGCDGSRSIVRKLGGFEFAGTEPEFTGYSTKVELLDPEKLKPSRNVTPKGMYMQSQPGYIMIQDFDGGEFHHSKKQLNLDHVQEVLRRISDTDVTITALHTATTWTDLARQATAYRNGKILLAGDAAHIHSPLGGQGLNLGLGDAMNLGWKLAATLHEKAPEGLLDTYYTERHPIGAQVLDWSRAQVAIMKPDPAARALQAIIRDLMHTQDGATYFAGRVWGVATHYNLDGNHPLTGYSVPNFEFEDGTDIGMLLYDAKGILLDFSGNALIKTLVSEYSDQVGYYSVSAENQFGLSAVLVRPDGIVAWAGETEPDLTALKNAMANWFVRDAVTVL